MESCPHRPETLRTLFEARDYVTGEVFRIERCTGCGVAFTLPRPAQLGRYYPPQYYGPTAEGRFPRPVEIAQRWLCARRARAVERAAGRVGRVLDVGCGRGLLLDAFRRRGWEVAGTELSDASAAYPRALGIPVHVGPIRQASWEPGSFDAVLLWHVIEHWPDPHEAIREAHRLLRDGGVLAIGAPNFESPEARLARHGWFHLDVPRHLAHLGPSSLWPALAAHGFSIVRSSFFAPEYDTFSFVQSVQNLLGLRPNLLYDVLRGDRAKLGARAGPAAIAASLALALPLGMLALPATALLALARRGSSLTVLARKRSGA
ncbi:MAG TPA: class I SAM-dependent methyltransferase [Anaeromyxobacteraceae bacterium]|nr:class I SAM-dependent methyltransferase [Anaeromyxobacteraceae bacterium]